MHLRARHREALDEVVWRDRLAGAELQRYRVPLGAGRQAGPQRGEEVPDEYGGAEGVRRTPPIEGFGAQGRGVNWGLATGVYLGEGGREMPLRDGDKLAIWPRVAGG